MTFSIIIPVFNVAPYISECLDSLIAQDYSSWEAICVDDGSTDGSGNVLDEYALRDKRINVIHQSNSGVSAARNQAQQMATGDWLMYLDADDIYLKGALREIHELICSDNGKNDLYLAKDYVSFKSTLPDRTASACRVVDSSSSILAPYLKHNLSGFSCMRIALRSGYSNIAYPTGVKMMEDILHLFYCMNVRTSVAVISGCFYGYRDREGSASNFCTWERASEVMKTITEIMTYSRKALSVNDVEISAIATKFIGVYKRYIIGCFSCRNTDFVCSTSSSRKAFAEKIYNECVLNDIWKGLDLLCKTRIIFGMKHYPASFFKLIEFFEYVFFGIRARVTTIGSLMGGK